MQIGMIGLGRMGANMSRRLIRGGHGVVAYDRSREAVAALCQALGAREADAGCAGLKDRQAVTRQWVSLPRVDPEMPRAFLIAGAYPFGGVATVSTRRWDARVAVLDSSPIRGRSFSSSPIISETQRADSGSLQRNRIFKCGAESIVAALRP